MCVDASQTLLQMGSKLWPVDCHRVQDMDRAFWISFARGIEIGIAIPVFRGVRHGAEDCDRIGTGTAVERWLDRSYLPGRPIEAPTYGDSSWSDLARGVILGSRQGCWRIRSLTLDGAVRLSEAREVSRNGKNVAFRISREEQSFGGWSLCRVCCEYVNRRPRVSLRCSHDVPAAGDELQRARRVRNADRRL